MSRGRRVGWAVLGAALALLACSRESDVEPEPQRPAVVTPVVERDLEERIEASGELLAKNSAIVAAQVAGEITQVLVDEGQPVSENQVVIEIDPEKRKLELEVAAAGVAEAEAGVRDQLGDETRVRALSGKNIASTERLENVQAGLDSAQSRLRAARARAGTAERAVRDASVKARFEGLIARRFVSRGEFVQPGQRLFELVSLDPIEVEFHLPEADSARVRLGVPIEVTVAPYPDEVFQATVDMVSPTIDPRTRTLRVKALIDNADGRLRPGLFARAHLGIAQRRGVLMVPEAAVLQRADGQVVFRVLEGNRVQRVRVEGGAIHGDEVEVRSGLSPGDLVVSRGHADLIDGAVIVPRNADGTLADSDDAEAAEATP